MNYLRIGGQDRPILFGMAGLYQYEQRTGRAALSDFQAYAAKSEETSDNYSLSFLIDVIYCGLAAGCRKEKQPVDFDEMDVAEWLGTDMGLIEQAMKFFAESFPQEKNLIAPTPPAARKTKAAGT